MKPVLILVLGLLVTGCGRKNEPGPPDRRPERPAHKEPDVPSLIKELNSPDYQVRRKAAKTIGERAPMAEAAIPALSEMVLADEDSITRDAAADALRNFGPKATEVVPKLLKAFKEERGFKRDTVISCLGRLGLEPEMVVPVLQEAIEEPQPTRNYALRALGNFGPGAKAALPQLQKSLQDASPHARVAAARAVWEVSKESKDALPVLLEALKDTSKPPLPQGAIVRLDDRMLLRREAAQTLGEMGPAAKEAVPALVTAIKDRSPDVRVEAALALWKVDRQADPAVKTLIEVLETKDPSESESLLSGAQAEAAQYLGEIGAPARSALPLLQRLSATSPSREVQEAAAAASKKIDPGK